MVMGIGFRDGTSWAEKHSPEVESNATIVAILLVENIVDDGR